MESTIEGVYATNASKTPAINAKAPSAIAGTHSTSTSTRVSTTALIVSPRTGALAVITLQSSTIASPILATIAGISPATPVITTVKPATTAVAPAVRAAAKAVNPTANADKPIPAAKSPAPIATTPTPIRANAPLNARIVPTNGVRTAPATPITVNAPATVIKPFAMLPQLIAPKTLRTGVKTAKAVAATSIAAEPANVPFIRLRPIANSAKAPPIAISPLAISSHEDLPILPKASATISRAAPTTIRPAPMPTMFLGIKFVAIATSAKAPPIATSPLAISFHENLAKSLIADANIFIAAAISTRASPEDITCFAFPVSFVNAAISRSNAPIAVRPFPISPHFI